MKRIFRRGSRIFFLLILAVAISGITYVDKNSHVSVAQLSARQSTAQENQHSRVWYCVGGSAQAGSVADATVSLSNLGNGARNVTISALNDQGQTADRQIVLAAASSSVVHLSDILAGDFVSAVVTSDSDGVVADLIVRGPQGVDVSPCQARLLSDVYFAGGSTFHDAGAASGSNTFLSILNPSADVVSADISVTALSDENEPTDSNAALIEDARKPIEWTNKQLRPHTLTVLDVGSLVAHRAVLSVHIAATPGRIVAGELVVRNSAARTGLSLLPGTSLAQKFYFAYGIWGDGVGERLTTFFPATSSDPTESTVLMQPRYPLSDQITSMDPIERKIDSDQFDFLNVGLDARVPKGITHSWEIESDNPIAITRAIDVVATKEVGESNGVSEPDKKWVIPYTGTDVFNTSIEMANFSATDATIGISVFTAGKTDPAPSVASISIKAGQRLSLPINAWAVPGSTIIVSSSQLIVVERTYSALTGSGFSVAPAIAIG